MAMLTHTLIAMLAPMLTLLPVLAIVFISNFSLEIPLRSDPQ